MAEETPQNDQPPEHSSADMAETPEGHNGNDSENAHVLVNELQQKLETAQKLADTYKDQFLRKAAEFDNYKKRSEMEYATMAKNANERLIRLLIPILDDFARSLKAERETRDLESLLKGIELIYNKFTKLLESQGLLPFESVGKTFNVEQHDALLQVPRSDVPPHTVVEEIERGYKLFDKVLRHAKVIVSAEPTSDVQSGDEAEGTEKN